MDSPLRLITTEVAPASELAKIVEALLVVATQPLSPEELAAAAHDLGEPLVVRSSAAGEDAAERSAAGQFETLLDVSFADLADAVDAVRRSGSSIRARAYRTEGEMAVVIQRQVRATRAGVAFSRDPLTAADEVVIEAVFGYGDALVSGTVAPDRYRVTGDAVRARVADKGGATGLLRTLRDDEAHEVARHVRRAEAAFATPVDVEFCFEAASLWLVQCRPITTLS
jgi:pyruvate,water dikinase